MVFPSEAILITQCQTPIIWLIGYSTNIWHSVGELFDTIGNYLISDGSFGTIDP